MVSDLPVQIRELHPSDHPLVLDSWTNTALYSSPAMSWAPRWMVTRGIRSQVQDLLAGAPHLFRVLVRDDDPDQIFAWRCGDGVVTHFVYTKKPFRRMCLAGQLIGTPRADGGWIFSWWSIDCERIGGIEYRPSLLREALRDVRCTTTLGDRVTPAN